MTLTLGQPQQAADASSTEVAINKRSMSPLLARMQGQALRAKLQMALNGQRLKRWEIERGITNHHV